VKPRRTIQSAFTGVLLCGVVVSSRHGISPLILRPVPHTRRSNPNKSAREFSLLVSISHTASFGTISSIKFEIITSLRKTYLGELEELVLLTVALFYNREAYGVAITEKLIEQTDREISISAVHATLHRLEEKGFLKSTTGGATTERGGRRKRFFTITQAGAKALKEVKELREQFWQQIPVKSLQPKVG
jgi:DNA-binding PadR family transcriptional regulator